MMSKYINYIVSALLFMAISSCSDEMIPNETIKDTIDNSIENGIPTRLYATIGMKYDTRTAYTEENDILHTLWKDGDQICLSPAALSAYADIYQVSHPTGDEAVFELIKSSYTNADKYLYYYPGNLIHNDIQFMNFSYEGQIQHKEDPTAHLGDFHSMRYESASRLTQITFSEGEQSACMKMELKGVAFNFPKKVQVRVLKNGGYQSVFYANNGMGSYYVDRTYGGSYEGLKQTDVLTLDLEGYDVEDGLSAYLMMSNRNITLESGSQLEVMVYCEDGLYTAQTAPISDSMTLNGGFFHNLTINGGWVINPDVDLTEYEYDGEVTTLQEVGQGPDLVIMGDGFINEDFQNGTYDEIMMQAYDEFFQVEPLKSFKDDFNVYYIKTVSPQRIKGEILVNGIVQEPTITKFSTVVSANSTHISGNTGLALEYAKKAFQTNANERIKNATVVMMVNIPAHAGTCHSMWSSGVTSNYGESASVAFCALGKNDKGRRDLMRHEICGHGFGKLADEYYYNDNTSLNSGKYVELEGYHAIGLYRNVDLFVDDNIFTTFKSQWPLTTAENVLWSNLFGTSNQYESADVESLGIYKGAYTYPFGFCRPTEDRNWSVMFANGPYFNAISRKQILYRIKNLLGQGSSWGDWGSEEELQHFLDWDRINFIPTLNATRSIIDTNGSQPLDPPVLIKGSWLDGHFIPDAIEMEAAINKN